MDNVKIRYSLLEEIIWIRKTIPLQDWTQEMLDDNICTMEMSYGVQKNQMKEFLEHHPELIERNKDKDLSPYF